MLGLLYIVVLLFFYKLQRQICSKTVLRKKLIIPLICFILSIVGSIFIIHSVTNHGNKLIAFPSVKDAIITQKYDSDSYSSYSVTSNSKEYASVTISKKQIFSQDVIKIVLILNIPTLLFTMFIFTGNNQKMRLENQRIH